MSLNPVELDVALKEWLPRAEAGDHIAAAYVAIIRYLSDPDGSRDELNNWLRRAMASDDPEFLIALAEELVIGTAIYRDIKLASDCLSRALTLSELKGSYAMARFTVVNDRNRYLKYLKRTADLGHVPSKQQLLAPQRKGNRFYRRLQSISNLPKLFSDTRKVFTKTAIREHWWRYKDVYLEKVQDDLYRELGEDRRCYFAWARPSPISVFAMVLAKGHSEKLVRGQIDAYSLLPKTVDDALLQSDVTPSKAASKTSSRASKVIRVVAYISWIAFVLWTALRLIDTTIIPTPIVRDEPPKAIIDVGIRLKDGSLISKTFRPNEFSGTSGDSSITFSEQPGLSGEPSRGIFLTLEKFDGKSGAASFSVLPTDRTSTPVEADVAGYGKCAYVQAFGQATAIRICTKEIQGG